MPLNNNPANLPRWETKHIGITKETKQETHLKSANKSGALLFPIFRSAWQCPNQEFAALDWQAEVGAGAIAQPVLAKRHQLPRGIRHMLAGDFGSNATLEESPSQRGQCSNIICPGVRQEQGAQSSCPFTVEDAPLTAHLVLRFHGVFRHIPILPSQPLCRSWPLRAAISQHLPHSLAHISAEGPMLPLLWWPDAS